jgi:hypothetical protein
LNTREITRAAAIFRYNSSDSGWLPFLECVRIIQ